MTLFFDYQGTLTISVLEYCFWWILYEISKNFLMKIELTYMFLFQIHSMHFSHMKSIHIHLHFSKWHVLIDQTLYFHCFSYYILGHFLYHEQYLFFYMLKKFLYWTLLKQWYFLIQYKLYFLIFHEDYIPSIIL